MVLNWISSMTSKAWEPVSGRIAWPWLLSASQRPRSCCCCQRRWPDNENVKVSACTILGCKMSGKKRHRSPYCSGPGTDRSSAAGDLASLRVTVFSLPAPYPTFFPFSGFGVLISPTKIHGGEQRSSQCQPSGREVKSLASAWTSFLVGTLGYCPL